MSDKGVSGRKSEKHGEATGSVGRSNKGESVREGVSDGMEGSKGMRVSFEDKVVSVSNRKPFVVDDSLDSGSLVIVTGKQWDPKPANHNILGRGKASFICIV
ncbi:hypothetical protein S245_008041 [Arachis hypogaea]